MSKGQNDIEGDSRKFIPKVYLKGTEGQCVGSIASPDSPTHPTILAYHQNVEQT